jgi:hypothetical protein
MAAPLETPVAFLVFNRPDTTARVLGAIRAARPRKLLVIADGPRPDRPGEAERCAAVRALVDQVDWPCEVKRSFSDVNLGCGRRISSGLAWVFAEEERAIVLEDDCLPHPDFFPFCERLLDRYADDERVAMIGGTNFLLDELRDLPSSYFFSRYFAIWGWATWRRAWARYDFRMSHWPALREVGALATLYRQPFMQAHMARVFDLVHGGEIDTWDVQWFHACLFDNGLSVTPRANLVSNIGHVGTHTSDDRSNHDLPVFGLGAGELVAPPLVFPERRYDEEMFRRQFAPKPRGAAKLVARLRRALAGKARGAR